MAKELPSTNASPDVFQLFNENRTFYFETDISSIPNPPVTVAELTPPTESGSLTRRNSMPCLANMPSAESNPQPTTTTTTTTLSSAFQSSTSSLPAAIALDGQFQPRTDSSYRSSKILKSFQHDFTFFGQKKSVSNPGSPRRGSSPELDPLPTTDIRPRTHSDPRKLSLVTEEGAELEAASNISGQIAVMDQSGSENTKLQAPQIRARSVSPALDSVDAGRAAQQKFPITKKVMEWFTIPHTQAQVNRAEFNALSPASF